jgi:hypothetical protein
LITISAIRIRGGTGITIVEVRMIGVARIAGIDRIPVVDRTAGPVMVARAMVDLEMIDLVMVVPVIRMAGLAGPALRLPEMDRSPARVNTKRGVV